MNTPDLTVISRFVPLLIAYSIIVALFIKHRRDVKQLRQEAQEADRVASTAAGNLSLEVQGLRQSVRQMEEFPVVVPPMQTLNMTKRAQVIRMYRRGESVSTIAAALRTPSNEVQLVLKVHHMLHS